MKVLVIEDDKFKAEQLMLFVSYEMPSATCDHRKSFQSGLLAISELSPDIVLLDMVLPNFDQSEIEMGYETRLLGGVDVLREIDRERYETRVVVVTQFEDFGEGEEKTTLKALDASLRDSYPDHYVGAVYYHAKQLDWIECLREMLRTSGFIR